MGKYPIFELHDFEIGGQKVAGIFVGMQGEKVTILAGDKATEIIQMPVEELSADDLAWVRGKIREYAKKK